MEFIIKGSQLLLSLSILVVLHELGHFIPAKLFKTKVEKFYLFFDYKFSIFKKKIGDTEYGIGWIPLGGYVKIAGMIDESMDKEQMDKPAEDWEFRSKPAWQRLIVMLGGVFVNIILAYIIYISVLFVWGRTFVEIPNATHGMHADSVLTSLGFHDGDIPSGINESGLPENYSYKKLTKDALLGRVLSVQVNRQGENFSIKLPEEYGLKILESGGKGLFMFRYPFVIDSILPNGAAINTNLKIEDKVISINNVSTPFYGDFYNEIMKGKVETEKQGGKDIVLGVLRGNDTISVNIRTSKESLLGVLAKSPYTFYKKTKEEFTFGEAIPVGIEKTHSQLKDYVAQIPLLFTKTGASQIGGFGSMGKMFPNQWDWYAFWSLTAMLSVVLAFMNILPIPALDGGHALFLIYELIFRKKPADKFMEYAQIGGMALLFSLMLYANGNDLIKWISSLL